MFAPHNFVISSSNHMSPQQKAEKMQEDHSSREGTLSGSGVIAIDSLSLDYGGNVGNDDDDDDDDIQTPVSLRDDSAMTPSASEADSLSSMGFEVATPPTVCWTPTRDDCIPTEERLKSSTISACEDWMYNTMTVEAWEQLQDEETMDAVALRQLYWEANRGSKNENDQHDVQINEPFSTQRWSNSKWTSATWDYKEAT